MSFLSVNLLTNALGLVIRTKNVAIYDGVREILTGNILFDGVIISANVVEDSKICEHPIESGAVIADHKVFNPVEIDIRFVLPAFLYAPLLNEIKNIYKNSPKLRIGTKEGFFNNMVLTAKPHEEKAETVDRVIFDLHFTQVIEVEPKYIQLPMSKLKNPENSDTNNMGENVSKKSVSILKSGFNLLSGG